MRIVFIGTNKLSLTSAHALIDAGHEIIFIEKDKEKIDQLSNELDCGFIHGDGSAPKILEEVGPKQSHFLFCLTGNDKDNIIAGLVGRSLGFPRVIIKVEDFALEHICNELGLQDVIVPTRTISRYLADMIRGQDASELSTAIKYDARFFSFVAGEDEEKKIGEIDLPQNARIICFYRDGDFHLAADDFELQKGDEVIILTDLDTVETLKKKLPAQKPGKEKEEEKPESRST